MSRHGFALTAALVFLISAAVTIAWCGSMSRMPGMDMPGGWVMSMAWMRMPGQGWLECAVTFLGMWTVMMIAMMVPVLTPALARYRRSMGANRNALTGIAAAGYWTVWLASGLALFPLGIAFGQWTMETPEVSTRVPAMMGITVVAAGIAQWLPWKDRQLQLCCHALVTQTRTITYAHAWRQGLAFGLRCFYCCASLTAVLLVMGVMDLRAMALVTMAISAERLSPARMRLARVVGAGLILMGLTMLAG